ncbi:hypothetical protein ACLBWT_13235 [Paenibacillus sp. D51F]
MSTTIFPSLCASGWRRASSAAAALVAALMLLAAPSPAAAASLAVSSAAKSAFERTAAAAAAPAAARLNAHYGAYVSLTAQLEEVSLRAAELHLRNGQDAAAIRKSIPSIDTDRVAKQEAAVKKARSAYEPLYAAYTAMNHQASAASKYGSKELAKLARMQADTMKAAVQLARQQIRIQEDQLKAVRAERTRKMNAARKTLGGMDEFSLAIRSRQSAAKVPESAAAAALKDFGAAARKSDAAVVEKSLEMMNGYAKQLLAHKQAIVDLELRSASVAADVKKQLAAQGIQVLA